jgi:hypothetical protein
MGVLPASKWRFLRHLSLTDNSMTSIPLTSLVPLSNTLYSLDLSSNLFTQIPDSLATLTALRALNLSHCMIDSLHSLTRNPLPAITALNLRANRLLSLAGIEKLYPLERIDLRDNRLTDPMELARLTGIPDIREIWVESNPFTRTHKDYRINIFNLFRKTPGYTEDIIIDGSGPSYSEKRSLVDRVPVPDSVPVVKPKAPEIPAVDVNKPTIVYGVAKEPAVLRKERPVPKAIMSEVNTASLRRKKTPKRRIVDLATGETPPSPSFGDFHANALRLPVDSSDSLAAADMNYRISRTPNPDQSPTAATPDSRKGSAGSPADVPRGDQSSKGGLSFELGPADAQRDTLGQAWDTGGESYRRRIEALRDKVGNGYLSVLSEETWESSNASAFTPTGLGPAVAIRPAHASPAGSSLHSGRALGTPLSS